MTHTWNEGDTSTCINCHGTIVYKDPSDPDLPWERTVQDKYGRRWRCEETERLTGVPTETHVPAGAASPPKPDLTHLSAKMKTDLAEFLFTVWDHVNTGDDSNDRRAEQMLEDAMTEILDVNDQRWSQEIRRRRESE